MRTRGKKEGFTLKARDRKAGGGVSSATNRKRKKEEDEFIA